MRPIETLSLPPRTFFFLLFLSTGTFTSTLLALLITISLRDVCSNQLRVLCTIKTASSSVTPAKYFQVRYTRPSFYICFRPPPDTTYRIQYRWAHYHSATGFMHKHPTSLTILSVFCEKFRRLWDETKQKHLHYNQNLFIEAKISIFPRILIPG